MKKKIILFLCSLSLLKTSQEIKAYRGYIIERHDVVIAAVLTVGAGALAQTVPAWVCEHSLISIGALAAHRIINALNIHIGHTPLPRNQLFYLVALNSLFIGGKCAAHGAQMAAQAAAPTVKSGALYVYDHIRNLF